MLCSRAREDGYRTALETAGVPVDPQLIRHGDFHVERAYEEGRALLSLPDRPTAIFAGSDLQAFGLYEAARVLGLRVPDDLSVIGFDDLPMARWAWPPLTTIRQPLTEMAATATRIVLGDDTQTRVELATSLVVRQSTAALRRVSAPANPVVPGFFPDPSVCRVGDGLLPGLLELRVLPRRPDPPQHRPRRRGRSWPTRWIAPSSSRSPARARRAASTPPPCATTTGCSGS